MATTTTAKHPGDPTPRSPTDVMNDQTYRVVVNEGHRTWGGTESWHIIALHCGTETYWSTNYGPSQTAAPTLWRQVKQVVVQQTEWRAV